MRVLAKTFAAAMLVVGLVTVPHTADAISAKPNPVEFGKVKLTKTKTKAITIKVDPGYALFAASGTTPPWSIDFGTCDVGTVKSCKLKVTFSPTTNGVFTQTFTIYQCEISGPRCSDVTIALRGTGGVPEPVPPDPPDPPAPQSVIDFGLIAPGTTKTLPFTVVPHADYHISGPRGSGATAPWAFAWGTCSLGGTTPCVAEQTFRPTVAGNFEAQLIIAECHHVPGGLCNEAIFITVRGRAGVVGGKPNPADFGKVNPGKSRTKTIALKLDAGYGFANAGNPFGDPWSRSLGTCTVGRQKSCKIKVTFAPTYPGTFTESIPIEECKISNPSDCIQTEVVIRGHGGV